MFPLEELQDPVLEHNEFHGLIIVKEPWKAHWVTGIPGGVSDDTRLVNDTSSHRRHSRRRQRRDRKSTRLNSSHGYISYAVFCLKKKKKITIQCSHLYITYT